MKSEVGLRPLRAVGSPSFKLYEPEAVGAIRAYAPEGMGNSEFGRWNGEVGMGKSECGMGKNCKEKPGS